MQKNPYFKFLRSWSALIVLGVVVALVATNVALQDREKLYQSTATLQVGRLLDDKNPTSNDLGVIERLLPAYGEMARREPVLNAVIDDLHLSMSPEALRARMLVMAVPQTQLIDIRIVDADPEFAAAVANAIAREVVLQGPESIADDSSPEFIQTQLADLQEKITDAQEEAAVIDARLLSLDSAAEVFASRERLELLNAQIDAWQLTYARLQASVEPGHANIIRVVSEAQVPLRPLPEQTTLYYGLAAVVGGGMSTLLALGLSAIGRNISRPEDLDDVVRSTPVVSIPRYKMPRDGSPIALTAPESAATSAYRILRNTLRARHMERGHATLAVTSTRTGEGKTTTVANLGVALANSGLFVLLVDTNLRNPELDIVFGLDNPLGFSDLLLGDASLVAVTQPTDNPNLWVIGAGTVPVHYTDVLSSTQLGELVASLSAHADVVIFDTPAVFQERESQLLAQHVGGVLVIAEAGGVNDKDLRETLDVLEGADSVVTAIALNKTRERNWSLNRLPWSREARLRARAIERRRRHMRASLDSRPGDAHQTHSPAD